MLLLPEKFYARRKSQWTASRELLRSGAWRNLVTWEGHNLKNLPNLCDRHQED